MKLDKNRKENFLSPPKKVMFAYNSGPTSKILCFRIIYVDSRVRKLAKNLYH